MDANHEAELARILAARKGNKDETASTNTTTQSSKSDVTIEDLHRRLESEKQEHQKTREELEILRYEFEQLKKDNVTRDLEMHKLWTELKKLSK